MILSGLLVFKYAGYTHPAGEVIPQSFDTSVTRTKNGFVKSVQQTMSLKLNIIAASDAAIDARILEIQAQYVDRIADAILYLSNGQPSHFTLHGGYSINGIQVDGPHWSVDTDKADFVTGISCDIGLTAHFDPAVIGWPQANKDVANVTESIEVIGDGAPSYKMVELDNGLPQITQVRVASPVFITQSGQATWELSKKAPPRYPDMANYLFSRDNILDPVRNIRQRHQKQRSLDAETIPYSSAWSYTYTFDRYPFIKGKGTNY